MLIESGIASRRWERYEIVLPVRIRLLQESANRVRFTPHAAPKSGYLSGDLIDMSRGGAGVMLTEYLPTGARAEMRICGTDGDPTQPLLVSKVRIQRSRMTDSRPAYFVGTAFTDIDGVFEHDLELLLKRLDNKSDETPGLAVTDGGA